MRLVMFVRTSRCPEYRSSYLPFEDYHAQKKCANLTTEIVFNMGIMTSIKHAHVAYMWRLLQLTPDNQISHQFN